MPQAVAKAFDEADRRDPKQCVERVVLVDGQYNQLVDIINEAQNRKLAITIIIDLIHVLHYVWVAALAIRADRTSAESWAYEITKLLLTRTPKAALANMKCELNTNNAPELQIAFDYIETLAPYLNYANALQRGLPIASGTIEGACRHIVQDRLGVSGACWRLNSAEAVLRLRAAHASTSTNRLDFHVMRNWRTGPHERQEAIAA
jgi:hypothetical protein